MVQHVKKISVWVSEEDNKSTMLASYRAKKSIIYAVFFQSTELVKDVKLRRMKTVAGNWYTSKCLSKI